MRWTRFLALLPILLPKRRAAPLLRTKTRQSLIPGLRPSKIHEKITQAISDSEAIGAHSTFWGGALTIAQAHRTAAKHQPRRIALFGGSFDPVHSGHLGLACAADRRFNFDEIHFIPASRPGIRTEALRLVIPPGLMGRPNAKKETEGGPPSQVVADLQRTTIYLLENVSSEVSATEVRRRAHRGQSIHGLVSARVEESILKQGLYR